MLSYSVSQSWIHSHICLLLHCCHLPIPHPVDDLCPCPLHHIQFQLQSFEIVCNITWSTEDTCCDLPGLVSPCSCPYSSYVPYFTYLDYKLWWPKAAVYSTDVHVLSVRPIEL